MRVVKESVYKDCKVTIFSWNEKYLIKLEQGFIEQTFKVNEMDIIEESDLNTILNEQFMEKAFLRFNEMHQSLAEAMSTI